MILDFSDDLVLIEELIAGNPDALSYLYKHYDDEFRKAFMRIDRRHLFDFDDARDYMIEHLRKDNWRKLQTYDDKKKSKTDGDKFLPWLLVVASRSFIDYCKKEGRHADRYPTMPDPDFFDSQAQEETSNNDSEYKQTLSMAVKMLSPENRRIVQTFLDGPQGITQRDVAKQLGLTDSKVSRAIKEVIKNGRKLAQESNLICVKDKK